MIWESTPWKISLIHLSEVVTDKIEQVRWYESSFAKLEQTVMLGFYSVRKLIESKKLSDDAMYSDVQLLTWKAKGRDINLFNWHQIDRLYDLRKATKQTRKLQFVANQIIHSFVFHPIMRDEKRVKGIAFNSDRTKDTELYYLDLSQIAEIFRIVGRDNPRRGKYIKSNGQFFVNLESDL